MIVYLNQIDKAILFFFNGLHTPLLDQVMLFITGKFIWIPLYILIVGLLMWKYKKASWLVIMALVLAIAASDQFASTICKPTFKRLRPCHHELLKSKLHIINPAGGKYGFISSHAANTFALAIFMVLALKEKRSWIGYPLLVWAGLVSLSRVYLGVHYPSDIFFGAISGIFWAWLFWKGFEKVESRRMVL